MRLLTSFLCLSLFTSGAAVAQSGYFEDAYRFSKATPAGSARIVGVGGTQWSLGGDVSNLAGNPAGLGFFRNSEVSLSLGYNLWSADASYLDQTKSYRTSDFSLPNLSFVGANPKGPLENGAFKGGAWGFSIQRIANFSNEFGYYSDKLGNSSIIDFYLGQASGVPENQIENSGLTGLAYQTYQINPIAVDANGKPITNPKEYDSFVLGVPFQDENVTQEGNASQINFGYGANFNHKLFIGGSIGIRSIEFSSIKKYNEEFTNEPLINSSLLENLYINGTGVNLNLGLIYKPIDYVNLGFVLQTPTWFAMNEEYEASMTATYDNYYFEPEDKTLGTETAVSDIIMSNYGLYTPFKVGGGATIFLGKYGFISADVDWVDYSSARLSSSDFNEGPDNQVIQNLYSSTVNYRFGAEGKLQNWRIRGGYAHQGDPFVDNSGFNQSTQQLSGGIGVQFDALRVDFSLVNQNFNSLYRSYKVLDRNGLNYGPLTEIKNSITSAVVTVGFNF
ncbi:MAG: long-chain fatty acid transporter [Algoriphagus sp.]|nr:long-chain fatty acid transporter [Algoriphagus sp.]MCE2778556.1 long-chain fatty acid transporter [Algoriphagus sp.]